LIGGAGRHCRENPLFDAGRLCPELVEIITFYFDTNQNFSDLKQGNGGIRLAYATRTGYNYKI
jgi:hypothetical protein